MNYIVKKSVTSYEIENYSSEQTHHCQQEKDITYDNRGWFFTVIVASLWTGTQTLGSLYIP
ncbi:MAG: hypothetical protein E7D71_04795 [Varibaculum cambriense]|nr:hypothetical protein [Varibaculum cambriense]